MSRPDRKVVVEIAISKLVPVTSNDGGYLGRQCLICGAGGWDGESDYGYRHGYDGGKPTNRIVHARNCVLNQYIERDTGRLIPARPREKKKKPLSFCNVCNRDTKSPLFDGCATPNCPRGFKPCL